jgi:hypothetical protein
MKNARLKTLTFACAFLGITTANSVWAKSSDLERQPIFETVKTAIEKLKHEHPFSEQSLSNIKADIVNVARSAGCNLADLLVLNSFASRLNNLAKKAPAILSDLGKEFFNTILPRHEDTIIHIMQQPEFAPVQELISEHLGELPQMLEQQPENTFAKHGNLEEKVDKLNGLLNGYQGQIQKLIGVLLAVGVYAEALTKNTQNAPYQDLFNDVKSAIIKSAAKHLDLCDINHLERFLKSDVCSKLLTRYDELALVAIKAFKPGFYQSTANSLWGKAKSFAGSIAATVYA